jgi:hypothetical protein
MSAALPIEQQPHTRESFTDRIQRERDAAVAGEWAQIDRIGRAVATCLEGTATEMREIAKVVVYDRTSALTRLEAMIGVIDEAAVQLRNWRVPPDANAERKGKDAKDAAEAARA